MTKYLNVVIVSLLIAAPPQQNQIDVKKLSRAQLENAYLELQLENAKLNIEIVDLRRQLLTKRADASQDRTTPASGDSRESTPVAGQWKHVETTSLAGKLTGKISNGTIVKTASGGIYEVDEYIYLYEYVYFATVEVLSNGPEFKLIVEGIKQPLHCRQIRSSAKELSAEPGKLPDGKSDAIESTIVSDFDGLGYQKVYRLQNGQIWEQSEPYIYVYVAVMPRVTIWHDGSSYKMKVDGVDRAVSVQPLKK